ncbi:hypothetical protein D3C78_1332820 [compost metagenome]
MFGLGGEADAERAVRTGGDAGQDVRVADHLQQQAVTCRGVFLEFLWGDHFRSVVRDRSRGDENIAGHRSFAGGEHVASADYVDAADPIRRWQMHRPTDQGDFGTGFDRRFSQGKAHFPGAVVGDVAHRIDVFLGRSSGDHDVLAGQRLALEAFCGAPGQVVGFEHASEADIATGLTTGGWAIDLDVAAL